MKESKKQERMELPFHSPTEKEEWYKYECSKCGFKDEIPSFILSELAELDEIEGFEGSATNCPRCGFKMKYKGSFYHE